MADINIQRKKAAPSPWLLVLLAVALLGAAAYFFLRPDPADEATPPANANTQVAAPDTAAVDTTAQTLNADTSAPASARQAHPETLAENAADNSSADTPATVAAQAAQDPASPDYARTGLQKLANVLVSLADRDDLRDPTILEQRDNLTSATARLGEPNASLRPGFVAAAGLIRAMQQKAYPELESQANDLTQLSGELSGRSATAADRQQNQRFLTQAAQVLQVLNEPATGLN